MNVKPVKDLSVVEFAEWALGKGAIDWDDAYGCQCVDLARFWWHNIGIHPQPRGVTGAKDFYLQFENDSTLVFRFDKIPNVRDTVPLPGDTVIWNAHAKNGFFGHIAVVLEADQKQMKVIEQNYIPQKVGTRIDYYQNCLGFLRKKQ